MASRSGARTPSRAVAEASSSSSRVAKSNGPTSARKRTTATDEDASGDHAARKSKKSRSGFNPRPIAESSVAGYDEGDLDLPPPPPSERKPARRRESTHAKLARVASPAPSRAAAQLMPGSDSEDDGTGRTRAESMFNPSARASVKQVHNLSFKKAKRPRPSAAPPPSPGQPLIAHSRSRRESRRARVSMRYGEFEDSTEPLRVENTPVTVKNRDLRDARRRESLGKRGQRASSSFGRGGDVYPHPDVPSQHFYKHFDSTASEPVKAKWLIAWCARRALDETIGTGTRKGKQRAANPEIAEVDQVLNDVLDNFVSRLPKMEANVYGPIESKEQVGIPVKPNPKNVENRARESRDTARIKRMKAEDRDWGRIVANANKYQDEAVAAIRIKKEINEPPEMSAADEWFQQALDMAEEVLASSGDMDIGTAADFEKVEYEVDTLRQRTHRARQYTLQSGRFLNGIFASLSNDLRARDGERTGLPPTDSDAPDTVALLTAAGSSSNQHATRPDPLAMLRALAAADSNPDAVTKAAGVAPVAARTVAMTPGRPGATPRRPAAYGRGTPAAKR